MGPWGGEGPILTQETQGKCSCRRGGRGRGREVVCARVYVLFYLVWVGRKGRVGSHNSGEETLKSYTEEESAWDAGCLIMRYDSLFGIFFSELSKSKVFGGEDWIFFHFDDGASQRAYLPFASCAGLCLCCACMCVCVCVVLGSFIRGVVLGHHHCNQDNCTVTTKLPCAAHSWPHPPSSSLTHSHHWFILHFCDDILQMLHTWNHAECAL